MMGRDVGRVAAYWDEARVSLMDRASANGTRFQVGQRFHRTDLPSVVWRVMRVYRDSQGLEHATLASDKRDLDLKTLSVAVLLDRAQYRRV